MLIAVFDGDPGVLAAIRAALEFKGHKVITFSAVTEESARVVRAAQADVLLTDTHLPGDGFNVADKLMTGTHPPVVFMTASVVEEVQQHGAVALLPKPFGIHELTTVLEEVSSASQGGGWKRPLKVQR